tara:strand:+ start:154 stop:360 length:207 start_codon:yes stop_codon:yes gene_type:complete
MIELSSIVILTSQEKNISNTIVAQNKEKSPSSKWFYSLPRETSKKETRTNGMVSSKVSEFRLAMNFLK